MSSTSVNGDVATGPSTAGPSSRTSTPTSANSASRRVKRSHVAIACDRCRVQRTKCDNNRPCSNCKKSSATCSNAGPATTNSLSHAHREITRLRSRVLELEKKLEEKPPAEELHLATPGDSCYTPTPANIPASEPPLMTTFQIGSGIARQGPKGTLIRTSRSANETWYGPASLHYFLRRATLFLSSSLKEAISVDGFVPQSAAKLLHEPSSSPDEVGSDHQSSPTSDWTTPTKAFLSPTQEEYFLSLYWQSYHTALFPIMDEVAFKEHYRSLWTASSAERQPSALVDIVLAICMQFGVSSVPSSKQGTITDNTDATVAGRWHYRRCQLLLAKELESPTISTLQCHLLCAMYLCYASFQNMADTACAVALRTAYMLGLHMEPSESLPLGERELRKRLWWSLYQLDTKVGMKLGRPFLVREAPDMPTLPEDGLDIALVSGSNFGPLGDNATWLSFHRQEVKLFIAAKRVYTAFYDQDIISNGAQAAFDDPQTLEAYADFFRPHTAVMNEWVMNVPTVLKIQRRSGGIAYSTDYSALSIELFAPTWLQRQRVLLELMYHNMCINMYRPFISFNYTMAPLPAAMENARRSASHAIALTHIVHQVLSSTSILDGWIEAFQLQWNAAMTIVGFLLACSAREPSAPARNGLRLAIEIFDIYGNSFPVAASAASILRDLSRKLDILERRNQAHLEATDSGDAMMGQPWGEVDLTGPAPDSTISQEALEMASKEIFDLAMGIDLWGDLDMFWQSPADSAPDF